MLFGDDATDKTRLKKLIDWAARNRAKGVNRVAETSTGFDLQGTEERSGGGQPTLPLFPAAESPIIESGSKRLAGQLDWRTGPQTAFLHIARF